MCAGSENGMVLTDTGGDRATGYAMNNKIVSVPDGLLCTWLDSGRQNRWAVVDRDRGEILRRGTIGAPGLDNHCGAALARSGDAVHALIGGHHGPLEHHVLQDGEDAWRSAGVAGDRATYPSVVVDPTGRLHVFYRCGGQERWSLNYVRLSCGRWTDPAVLVRAHKPGYVYWTNGAAACPDGAVHLVFGNPRVVGDGALHYGASHLRSDDGGETWAPDDGDARQAPITGESIPDLGDAGDASRRQSAEDQAEYEAPGPENYNYQQMNLSNPVVSADGALHVILHHNRRGTAALWSLRDGGWSARQLSEAVLDEGGGRVHPQSSLSVDRSGTLHAALMVAPTENCVWGPPGTYLVRATVDGDRVSAAPVSAPEPGVAQWLPAFHQPPLSGLDRSPAILYTRGVNAGGFGNNQNALNTEVILHA